MYRVPPLHRARCRLWLPPKVWLHGSQSVSTGGSVSTKGQICRIICWLAQSIRWVLSTPLGVPVDPEVKRIFATESGVRARRARSTSGVAAVARSAATVRSAGPGRPETTVVGPEPTALPVVVAAGPAVTASRAARKRSPSSANTSPGRTSPAIARSRPWSVLRSE